MNKHKTESPGDKISQSVDRQAQRKLKARRDKRHSVWFGLGMFGLIGWAIAIPTLAGIALGLWIDRQWPSQVSWTLTLLFVGVVLGCMNAWRWIGKERDHD
ncbi:MAG: AtpZ/AtpI family protein [Methylobacter sp.]|uniref:AtpZ/AtpI family protein n=1 Tax=Methylobacter sp. TaxID=2051955 RepID=UPI00258398B7|nr:AtpZ/AtpI family protein [Methylobacter sp.]MCL7421391.1 AtpZ/AtpI family protein [Methylobacter sp.]